MMGRELSDKEMDNALNEIDRDCGGEVDFDEFVKWWNKQDASDKMVMEKQKAFDSLVREENNAISECNTRTQKTITLRYESEAFTC